MVGVGCFSAGYGHPLEEIDEWTVHSNETEARRSMNGMIKDLNGRSSSFLESTSGVRRGESRNSKTKKMKIYFSKIKKHIFLITLRIYMVGVGCFSAGYGHPLEEIDEWTVHSNETVKLGGA